ncbi:MBL fold metallo-hydrolase [Pseudonocardia sp.]|uniref:MBL fold metallo-hydrolase n=1 Tax=Pseudonocardia sp. TaxID=60912 RepID=UPI0031FDE2AE
MEIGGYRVEPVVDEGRLRPDEPLPGVPAARWERHRALLDDGGLLPIVIGGFLLRGHGRTVLIDLGYGAGALGDTPTGRMPSLLRVRGVEPADVTDVLFTHLHRDHAGWAVFGGVAARSAGWGQVRHVGERELDEDHPGGWSRPLRNRSISGESCPMAACPAQS